MSDHCLLELNNISKSFSGVKVLDDVNLKIKRGKVLALVGENGAGKSTLMKILVGVYTPDKDSGEMKFEGEDVNHSSLRQTQDLGISIIYQEFSLVPYLKVYENIFLGRELRTRAGLLDKTTMRRKSAALLSRLGMSISPDEKIYNLSIAEQQFVEIAKAVSLKVKVLILDEPTAPLTPKEVENLFKLIRELKAHNVGMVFISHHLEEIFQIADEVLILRDGCSVGYKDIAETNIRELIHLMVGRNVDQEFPKNDNPIDYSGVPLLSVHKLKRDAGCPEVAFDLYKGEILGIAGLVGAGRSELVKALIGADSCEVKELELNGVRVSIGDPASALESGIGLLPEDRKTQGLIVDFSIESNIVINSLRTSLNKAKTLDRNNMSERSRKQIKDIRIKTNSERTIVKKLSGGNQQKVVIGKWLSTQCKILIFDEPTRGIDVGAKAEIYNLMRYLTNRGIGIIMISSELPEIVGISDRVLVMRKNNIVAELAGEKINPDIIMEYATGVNDINGEDNASKA